MVLFMMSRSDVCTRTLTDFLAFGHTSMVLACKLLAPLSHGRRGLATG